MSDMNEIVVILIWKKFEIRIVLCVNDRLKILEVIE